MPAASATLEPRSGWRRIIAAIPAVIAFNHFKGRVKDAVTDCQLLARTLLAQLKATDGAG